MKTVIVVIMIFVCINCILKQTYRKYYMVFLSSAVYALFVGLMWPFAIEQSASNISHWLSDTALMLNIAVILTLSVIVQMAFCFLHVQVHTTNKVKPLYTRVYRILLWAPDLLIFPVLFYILVTAIFLHSGVSFQLVAWLLAAIIFIVIPVATFVVKLILPESSIRIEILFLSNAFIAVLGIIASVNGKTAVTGVSFVNWISLAAICMFAVIGLVCGLTLYKIKKIKK